MVDLQQQLLNKLLECGQADTSEVFADVDPQLMHGTLKSLASRDVVEFEAVNRNVFVSTAEGQQVIAEGSSEFRLFKLVGPDGCVMKDIKMDKDALKIGQQRAFKNKWIRKEGDKLVRMLEDLKVDDTRQQLQSLDSLDAEQIKELKRRKLIDVKKNVHYIVKQGPRFTVHVTKDATDITSENLHQLMTGDSSLNFKNYNFEAMGIPPAPRGHIHPLMKVRSEFRQIFFEMGFEEMPTNQYVESSFWNFDALFQPQDHPARDMHDTFFCKSPSKWQPEKIQSKELNEYIQRVKTVHSQGGYGSTGYNTEWKMSEAESLLLRTHTTAVSSAMLYKLFQSKDGFQPVKYFSIDKVFRNETVDATHLAEFHQVEGLMADNGLTIGDLIGFLDVFFKKLGMTNLKFKPTYNPYTEPSLEVFAYHPQLKRQIELGNSGMFRPEMLRPMLPLHMHEAVDKLPKDVRVIAWGLSLERPTMIRYGISNIRELVGHKVDLDMIYDNGLCRLDKVVDLSSGVSN